MSVYWNRLRTTASGLFVICIALPLTFCTASPDKSAALPLTTTEVSTYVNGIQEQTAQVLQQIAGVPEDQRTYENTIRPWNALSKDILANFGTLTFVAESHDESSDAAIEGLRNLQGFVYKTLAYNPTLRSSLLGYASAALSKPETVTPFDSYLIESLLNSTTAVNQALSETEQENIAHLKQLNDALPKEPYLNLTGNVDRAPDDQGKPLSVLTLNTCFVPGLLTYIHGGVRRWQERVAPLADLIRSTNADVVCLQEFHPDEANHALYEALKNDYAYFYGIIGPRFLGFDITALGLPSGLFVASKYPIEKPTFNLYKETGFPMNYGFFDFVVTDGSTPLAHVYNTHMQSLNQEEFPKIRGQQLKQVLDKMASDIQSAPDQDIPYLFVGDFNIPWGSKEPGEELIAAHFYDDYNNNRKTLDRQDATWTDYYTWYWFTSNHIPIEVKDNFGTLDYALL